MLWGLGLDTLLSIFATLLPCSWLLWTKGAGAVNSDSKEPTRLEAVRGGLRARGQALLPQEPGVVYARDRGRHRSSMFPAESFVKSTLLTNAFVQVGSVGKTWRTC